MDVDTPATPADLPSPVAWPASVVANLVDALAADADVRAPVAWPASVVVGIVDALAADADGRADVLRARLINRAFAAAGELSAFSTLTFAPHGKALRVDGFDDLIGRVGSSVHHLDVHGFSAGASSGGDGEAHKILLRKVATAIRACYELQTLVVDGEMPALIALGARTFDELHSLKVVAVLPRTPANHETALNLLFAAAFAQETALRTLELVGFTATSESAASLFHALRRSSIQTVRLIDCRLGPAAGAAVDFGPAYYVPIVAPQPLDLLYAERSSGFVHAAALAWSPKRLVLIETPTTPWPLACAHRASLTAVHLDDIVDEDALGELALNDRIHTISLFLRSLSTATEFLLSFVTLISASETAFTSVKRVVIRSPSTVEDYYGFGAARARLLAVAKRRAIEVSTEDGRDDEDQAGFVKRMLETDADLGKSPAVESSA